MLEQVYFTSSPKRLDGQAGFGVVAQTPGLASDDASGIAPYNMYAKPSSVSDDDVAGAPPSFSHYVLPSGRHALTMSSYVGRDYSGRFGNFFAHTVVADAADFAAVSMAPIVLYGHQMWVRSDAEPGIPVRPLESLPRIGPVVPSVLQAFFSEPSRERALAAMLQSVIDRQASGRRLVVVDTPANVVRWFTAVSLSMPPAVRASLTFTTLVADPARSYVDLVGVYPGEAAALSGSARFQFDVFDFANSPDQIPVTPGASAVKLARITARADDQAAERLWSLAAKMGALTPVAVGDAVWLDALSAGDAAPDEQTGRAIGLLAAGDPNASLDIGLPMLANLGQSIAGGFAPSLLGMLRDQAAKRGRNEELHAVASMAAARSLAEDKGDSWLGLIGGPELEAVRFAISEGLSPSSWQDALLRRVSGGMRALDLWWLLDQSLVRRPSSVDESFLVELSEAIRKAGSVDLSRALLQTVQSVLTCNEPVGLNVLGLVAGPLASAWPDDVVVIAIRAALGARARTSPVAAAMVELAQAVVVDNYSDALLQRLISESRSDPEFLAATSRALCDSRRASCSTVGGALGALAGAEGAQVRTILLRSPGADELLQEIAEHDLRSFSPIEVIKAWVPARTVTISPQQTSIIEKVLDKLDATGADDRVVKAVLASLGGVTLPPAIESRLAARQLSNGRIEPFSIEEARMVDRLRRTDPGNPSLTSGRLVLREALTGLDRETGNSRSASVAPFAYLDIRSVAVTAPEYREFLRVAFQRMAKNKVEPPASIGSPAQLWHAAYASDFAEALADYLGRMDRVFDRPFMIQRCVAYVQDLQRAQQDRAAQILLDALPRGLRKDLGDVLRPRDGGSRTSRDNSGGLLGGFLGGKGNRPDRGR